MRSQLLSAAFVLGQLWAGAQASPFSVVKRDDVTDWTIRGLHWDCSEDSSFCVYGFSIAEEPTDGTPSTPFFCHFTISGEYGESVVQSPFFDVPCEQSDVYRCGASWSDGGYMVLTVDNVQDNRQAYFGISGSEIEDGQFSLTHHSTAYVVIPSSDEVSIVPTNAIHTRDIVDSDLDHVEDDENVGDDDAATVETESAVSHQYAKVPGGSSLKDLDAAPVSQVTADARGSPAASQATRPTWSLRNVTRAVYYKPNAVSVDFVIDVAPESQAVPCHIRVDLDDNVEPMFASWFVEKCKNSDWYMSWGYNKMTDSAVATIINPNRTMMAWFGWDSVNAVLPSAELAAVGPGVVEACNC
ncbi:hypothetical protein SEPCBS119000_003779 [Sporothrix epigloea]|uniref:Uncharacterized protein n=1 Tax=Sporothrix epigloea TaxID=1892477 RepID=A0ABP0DS67_9PEZI